MITTAQETLDWGRPLLFGLILAAACSDVEAQSAEAADPWHSCVREIAQERVTSEKAIESLLARARQAFRETFLALARNLHTELS